MPHECAYMVTHTHTLEDLARHGETSGRACTPTYTSSIPLLLHVHCARMAAYVRAVMLCVFLVVFCMCMFLVLFMFLVLARIS